MSWSRPPLQLFEHPSGTPIRVETKVIYQKYLKDHILVTINSKHLLKVFSTLAKSVLTFLSTVVLLLVSISFYVSLKRMYIHEYCLFIYNISFIHVNCLLRSNSCFLCLNSNLCGIGIVTIALFLQVLAWYLWTHLYCSCFVLFLLWIYVMKVKYSWTLFCDTSERLFIS